MRRFSVFPGPDYAIRKQFSAVAPLHDERDTLHRGRSAVGLFHLLRTAVIDSISKIYTSIK